MPPARVSGLTTAPVSCKVVTPLLIHASTTLSGIHGVCMSVRLIIDSTGIAKNGKPRASMFNAVGNINVSIPLYDPCHIAKLLFIQHGDPKLRRFIRLGSRIFADNDEIRVF